MSYLKAFYYIDSVSKLEELINEVDEIDDENDQLEDELDQLQNNLEEEVKSKCVKTHLDIYKHGLFYFPHASLSKVISTMSTYSCMLSRKTFFGFNEYSL